MNTRTEHDSFGPIQVPADHLWGAQTQRSLSHFDIGCERFPPEFIGALAIVKRSCAIVNAALGDLTPSKSAAIVTACDEIIAGAWRDEFPLSIWQTGSGTQTNMNANEVIAARANQLLEQGVDDHIAIHPNDDVNRAQSSNDAIPTAMHIAAAQQVLLQLLPNMMDLRNSLHGKALEFAPHIKIARTHGMDATPMTLGQEFSGYVSQLDHGVQALRNTLAHLFQLALGGSAVGTGLNTRPQFAEQVAWEIASYTQIKFVTAPNKFEALAAHDAIVELSGALKRLAVSLLKIANDIRLLATGPRCGFMELQLPELEPGSSIMPGKVNPTQCEALAMICVQVLANDLAISLAGSQGQLELNTYKPMIIHNILQSIRLMADATRSFDRHCVQGITAQTEVMARYVEQSLMLVTALTPHIGYDLAARIAKHAHDNKLTLRDAAMQLGVAGEDFARWVQAGAMLAPQKS